LILSLKSYFKAGQEAIHLILKESTLP